MKTKATNADTLASVDLFQGLSPEECRQILDISICQRFDAGQVILRQGECSRNLWVVLEGVCSAYRVSEGNGTQLEGTESLLAEIEADSHFGEMSFFSSAEHSATVRAKTSVKLMRLHRDDYDRLLAADSIAAYKLAYNTIGTLSERVRQIGERWIEASGKANAGTAASEWNKFRGNVFDSWSL